ncbi:MAG: YhbY family RNA-binding protein [Gammaproteobacteria bacterium]
MALTERQRRFLRGIGHGLHPLILVGQKGVTPGVVAELSRALDDHELVKVRARVGDREARVAALSALAAATASELAFQIGNVGLFYKKNNKLAKLLIPDS